MIQVGLRGGLPGGAGLLAVFCGRGTGDIADSAIPLTSRVASCAL